MERRYNFQTGNIESLKAEADIIEEVSANEIYFGFCLPGTTLTSAARWAIMKITVTGVSPAVVTTTFKWAGGQCAFNLIWDSRAGYTYLFKNF